MAGGESNIIIVDLYKGEKLVREGITFSDIEGGETAVDQAKAFALHHRAHGRTAKGRVPKAKKVKKG